MKHLSFLAAIACALIFGACCNQNKQCPMQNDNATNQVMNTIMTRHSVRAYTSQEVSADTIETLLRAAMAAPTGMDVRPWRFVVLTDKTNFDTIFGADNMNLEKYKQAAVVFVLCADTTWSHPQLTNGEVRPNGNWTSDMGACAENLLLAAHAYGLGAVWTACYPYANRMDPVRAGLGLPDQVVPFCIIPVGYPAEQTEPKDKWNPENIHYNRW